MLDFIEFFTVVMTGLLAGALLTEARILVPYWKTMPPAEFLRLHHTMASSLFGFYAPLTIAGSALPIVTSILNIAFKDPSSAWWLVSGLCAISLLAFYFGFFKKANQTFADTSDATVAEAVLKKWAFLHNLRTLIAVGGFLAAVAAYSA